MVYLAECDGVGTTVEAEEVWRCSTSSIWMGLADHCIQQFALLYKTGLHGGLTAAAVPTVKSKQ